MCDTNTCIFPSVSAVHFLTRCKSPSVSTVHFFMTRISEEIFKHEINEKSSNCNTTNFFSYMLLIVYVPDLRKKECGSHIIHLNYYIRTSNKNISQITSIKQLNFKQYDMDPSFHFRFSNEKNKWLSQHNYSTRTQQNSYSLHILPQYTKHSWYKRN